MIFNRKIMINKNKNKKIYMNMSSSLYFIIYLLNENYLISDI